MSVRAHRGGRLVPSPRVLIVLIAALIALALPAAASAELPTLSVDPVTGAETTRAPVSGQIDAHGLFTEWWYETSTNGADWVRDFSFNGYAFGPGDEGATGTVQGLTAGVSTYRVRLAAWAHEGENAFQVEYSDPSPAFETDPAPVQPTVTLDPATDLSYTTAQLQGAVDPEKGNQESGGAFVPIHWALQLSETGDPGSFSDAAFGDLLTGDGAEADAPIAVGPAELSSLIPGHTYHYRLLVTYAGQEVEEAGEFTTLPVAKPTIEGLEASLIGPEGAHLSAEVDPGGTDPAFDTSWHFECDLACDGLKGGTLTGAEGPQALANDPALEPNTPYTITLEAANAGGTTEEAISFSTPAVAPAGQTLAAGQLQATSAVLNGRVNPNNQDTTYRFEWGTADCASNPCQSTPASEAGEDFGFHHFSAPLTGLTPDATYHFRILATNATGSTEGADRTFTTDPAPASQCANEALRVEQHSTFLPDCRAFELVSPPGKRGADVLADSSHVQLAADRSAAVFSSLLGFASTEGTPVEVDYFARRTALPGTQGWVTHPIIPSQPPMTATIAAVFSIQPMYEGVFSPDLESGLYRFPGALPGDVNVENVGNFYLRDDLGSPGPGSYELITPSSRPLPLLIPGVHDARPFVAGASTDLSRVFYVSGANLTSAGADFQYKLYEWHAGSVRLAGVLPDGSPPAVAEAGNSARTINPNAVSDDGSRVFFTARGGSEDNIYARVGAAVSFQLNRSERAVPESPTGATYQSAAPDGSRVFFTTGEGLIDSDDNHQFDLYMWSRGDHDETQQVTVDATGGDFTLAFNGASTDPIPVGATAAAIEQALEALRGPAPEELPILPAAEVSVSGPAGGPYAVSFGGHLAGVNVAELTADGSGLTGGTSTATTATTDPAANLTLISQDDFGADSPQAENVIGVSGDGRYVYFTAVGRLTADGEAGERAGIYLWRDGALSFVARLASPEDIVSNGPLRPWTGVNGPLLSRVSPDGRHLLFVSRDDEGLAGHGGYPGGFDHAPGSCEQQMPCPELYLFDADQGTLRCASCRRDGLPASGPSSTAFRESSGVTEVTAHLSHSLADDGRYVFFATPDPLVPTDTNGAFDVYRYDSHTDEQRLISTGTSPRDSYFMEAAPDGRDVLFTTAQRLNGWDTDESYDLYSARIEGGFAEPPPVLADCNGEGTCWRPVGPPPAAAGGGSLALHGEGNPPGGRRKCAKGRRSVRRQGRTRCIRRPRAPSGQGESR